VTHVYQQGPQQSIGMACGHEAGVTRELSPRFPQSLRDLLSHFGLARDIAALAGPSRCDDRGWRSAQPSEAQVRTCLTTPTAPKHLPTGLPNCFHIRGSRIAARYLSICPAGTMVKSRLREHLSVAEGRRAAAAKHCRFALFTCHNIRVSRISARYLSIMACGRDGGVQVCASVCPLRHVLNIRGSRISARP
jgi:hypothetical protein